jgi:hypothetical protein
LSSPCEEWFAAMEMVGPDFVLGEQ